MTITLTQSSFWTIIDEDKLIKNLDEDIKIKTLKNLKLENLATILYQYRFIVDSHANHLANLISLMPQSELKSFLGEILYEEIGQGKFANSHLKLFDNFLETLPNYNINQQINPEIKQLLDDYHFHIFHSPLNYALGLAGLGTECICQIYLTALFKQLKQNPNLKGIDHQIDWEFWLIHVGEVDISHRMRMRQMISEFITQGSGDNQQIIQGYFKSVEFWDNLFVIFNSMVK